MAVLTAREGFHQNGFVATATLITTTKVRLTAILYLYFPPLCQESTYTTLSLAIRRALCTPGMTKLTTHRLFRLHHHIPMLPACHIATARGTSPVIRCTNSTDQSSHHPRRGRRKHRSDWRSRPRSRSRTSTASIDAMLIEATTGDGRADIDGMRVGGTHLSPNVHGHRLLSHDAESLWWATTGAYSTPLLPLNSDGA